MCAHLSSFKRRKTKLKGKRARSPRRPTTPPVERTQEALWQEGRRSECSQDRLSPMGTDGAPAALGRHPSLRTWRIGQAGPHAGLGNRPQTEKD